MKINQTSLLLGLLQAITALGAIPAGLSMLFIPDGSGLGIPIDVLQGSPFPDFFIPGLFLFVINGLMNVAGAVLSFTRNKNAGKPGVGLGFLLVAWICIQVYFVGLISFLQPVFFFIGAIEIILGRKLILKTKNKPTK